MQHAARIDHADGFDTFTTTGSRSHFYRQLDTYCAGMRAKGKHPERVVVTFASGRTFDLDAGAAGL